MATASDAFKLTFQISPIILTGGIANNIPGQMLPIIAITEALNFPIGLLSGGGSDISLDNFFASYEPIAGGTFIDQSIGTYPFANQAVAANAVIANPLMVSMLMVCPARQAGGYATKLATMMALKSALTQHNSSGGTYTVATPANFYDNGILLKMTDVTAGQSKQVQDRWRLDFAFPLLTLQQAQQAQNNLMSQISGGTQIGGDPPSFSGSSAGIALPASLQTIGTVPAISGAGAGSVAAPTPPSNLQ